MASTQVFESYLDKILKSEYDQDKNIEKMALKKLYITTY